MSDSDSDEYGDTEFITSTIRNTTAALKVGKQNLKPTLPTATRTLSERGAADVRFGLKKGGDSNGTATATGTGTTPRKAREDKPEKKGTPTKNLSINVTPPSTPNGPRAPRIVNRTYTDLSQAAEEEEEEENVGRRSKRIAGNRRGPPPAKRGRGGRKPRMTKEERQANLAKRKTERALESLMASTAAAASANNSVIREDNDDVEEVDDYDSFVGQLMVKIEWKLDIFRLAVFPSDRIGTVLDRAAKHVDADPASVQLLLQGEALRRDQTIAAKGVTIASILELRAKGGVKKGSDEDEVEEEEELDEDQIQLKFRTKDRKSEVKLVIGLAEKFSVVMKQYAERRGVALKSLKFVFDGEIVNPDETPEDLDLEGEECIDVF